MNERQRINFERIANGEPLLPPVNQQEIMQVKLNERINESRGGGGGDFTTAEVTFVKDENYQGRFSTYDFAVPMCEDYSDVPESPFDGAVFVYSSIIALISDFGLDTITITVPLFKGIFATEILMYEGFDPNYISLTGDARIDNLDGGLLLLITGDCTITLSGGGQED